MNCQEALALLYDIIDKEATDIDAAEVRAHLDKCHDCLHKYNLESSVNALINERLKSSKATGCTEVIRKNIISQLDVIDGESAGSVTKARRFPFGGTALVMAIAATVVVVIGGIFVAASLKDHHAVFLPLEEAHWNAKNVAVRLERDQSISAQAVQFAHAVQYDLDETYDGFRLVRASVDNVMDMQMGHFVLEKGDARVSVFVAPSSFEIPSELEQHAVTINGIKMFDHNCRGCRLVYHRAGNAVIVTATTEKDIDLLKFAPGRGTI